MEYACSSRHKTPHVPRNTHSLRPHPRFFSFIPPGPLAKKRCFVSLILRISTVHQSHFNTNNTPLSASFPSSIYIYIYIHPPLNLHNIITLKSLFLFCFFCLLFL
ncbi:hypothetical protein L2E82_11227 [Cichorium intybus]|uniref:Uncharacterized protein n=1 Tax=Cichorium intybus TaxID=13427 RepID=A0ACB9GDS7_CICIN|nr:hypothetical protein L2E82_11227 [Cichorium intybus]